MNIIKSKAFLGVCLIFLALPFFINFLSCFHAPFASWIEPSPWTKFWGQYLSGFAAFAMLYVAWRTLMTTKESNRPFIALDIIDNGYSQVFLRCRNVGHSTATNINISISNDFFNLIPIQKVKESFETINTNQPFVLEPNGVKLWEIFLIPNTTLAIYHNELGKDAKYLFKGEYISKKEWESNEKLFKSKTFTCGVSYKFNNETFRDTFIIDYNNIVYGVSDTQLVCSYLNSIMTQLYNINQTLTIKR